MSTVPSVYLLILGVDHHARSELAQTLAQSYGHEFAVIDLDHGSERKTVNGQQLYLEYPEMSSRHAAFNELHERHARRPRLAVSGFCRTSTEFRSMHANAHLDPSHHFIMVLKTQADRSYARHIAARFKDQRAPLAQSTFDHMLDVNQAHLADTCRAMGHAKLSITQVDFETKVDDVVQTCRDILRTSAH